MDSLLASYASSDEEDSSPQQQLNPRNLNQEKKKDEIFIENPSKSSKFSLPPPKSSSFSLNPPQFQSHKPQKHQEDSYDESQGVRNRENSKPSSLFAALPQPKSSASPFLSLPPPKTQVTNPQLNTTVKRVVQFRPPLNPASGKFSNVDDEDEDEDEEEKERKRRKAESMAQTPTVKSFLSSIPAPKNSSMLGGFSSGSGTGRRSIVQADVPALSSGKGSVGSEVGVSGNVGGYDEGQYVDRAALTSTIAGGVSGSTDYAVGGGSISGDYSNLGAGNGDYVNYDGYSAVNYTHTSVETGDSASYGNDSINYGNHYENNWGEGSTPVIAPEMAAERELRLPSKRGRKDMAPQIVEVSQDELIKNRPREDQVKMTGIAFGPAYQPVSASKGKPSKLHKRKHQIGTLYLDMKQKEMELAERRSKGYQTKAQTQGKYGW